MHIQLHSSRSHLRDGKKLHELHAPAGSKYLPTQLGNATIESSEESVTHLTGPAGKQEPQREMHSLDSCIGNRVVRFSIEVLPCQLLNTR